MSSVRPQLLADERGYKRGLYKDLVILQMSVMCQDPCPEHLHIHFRAHHVGQQMTGVGEMLQSHHDLVPRSNGLRAENMEYLGFQRCLLHQPRSHGGRVGGIVDQPRAETVALG